VHCSRGKWLYLKGGESTGEHFASGLESELSNGKLRKIKQKQAEWGEAILGKGDGKSKAWSHKDGGMYWDQKRLGSWERGPSRRETGRGHRAES